MYVCVYVYVYIFYMNVCMYVYVCMTPCNISAPTGRIFMKFDI